jgi:hypothetical protein
MTGTCGKYGWRSSEANALWQEEGRKADQAEVIRRHGGGLEIDMSEEMD